MKVGDNDDKDNHYQYLVTVEQAEEDEEALMQHIRSEIKFLVDDDREGAKEYLKSFGECTPEGKTASKNEHVKVEDGELEPAAGGNKRKRGAASAASTTASSGSGSTGKKGKKAALGPIIDPRKLKKDTQFASHLCDFFQCKINM